jgi:hypothetical protein
MSNECTSNLNAKVFVVPLECATGELGPVVGVDPVLDPKSIDDGLDELDCGLLVYLDHNGHFRSLGEFVDGDVEIPVPSDFPGKWS